MPACASPSRWMVNSLARNFRFGRVEFTNFVDVAETVPLTEKYISLLISALTMDGFARRTAPNSEGEPPLSLSAFAAVSALVAWDALVAVEALSAEPAVGAC